MSGYENDPTENGFKIFHWRGQKRYRCPIKWESGADCEYDTHDLELMREHVREPHTRTGKRTQDTHVSSILTSEGKPFVVEDTPPDLVGFRFKDEE